MQQRSIVLQNTPPWEKLGSNIRNSVQITNTRSEFVVTFPDLLFTHFLAISYLYEVGDSSFWRECKFLHSHKSKEHFLWMSLTTCRYENGHHNISIFDPNSATLSRDNKDQQPGSAYFFAFTEIHHEFSLFGPLLMGLQSHLSWMFDSWNQYD